MVTASLFAGNREVDGSPKASRAKVARSIGVRSLLTMLLSVVTLVSFASADANAASFLPSLGAAAPYAILGVSPGTNIGLSNITGELGFSLSTSTSTGASASSGASGSGLLGGGLLSGAGTLTGSLLGSVDGATNVSHAAASAAESAAASAYRSIASETPTHVIPGSVLNDVTLTPGVYAVSGPLELVGRLLLNAHGAANPDFIFQIPSNLTIASDAQVLLGAGVRAGDVLWQVGGASALSPGTSFVGTILSNGPITLGTGSRLSGRALSLTSGVNLDSDSISVPSVSAIARAAGNAVAAAAKVAVRASGAVGARGVAAATPNVSVGAHLSLPLTTLTKVPTVGLSTTAASSSGVASVALPAVLPFIPLSAIDVPELEVPTLPTGGVALPSLGATAPLTNVSFPLVGIGAGLPTSVVPTLQEPSVPSLGTSAPTGGTAAPTIGLPTLPSVGVPTPSSIPSPLIGVPSLTGPTSPSVSPTTSPLPLSGLSPPALMLPSSVPSGVSLPGVTAPSNALSSAPASNALPLPLSGISLPQLLPPSSSAPSLPAVTLPTLTTPGVTLPRLSSGPSTSAGPSKVVHPRVKGNSSASHSTSTSHAKSGATTSSAKGSTIPVGAPQTGFGGAAGAGLDLALLALSAFLLAVCAGSFAIRARRIQRG
jgi:Ice-binding-like